MQLHDLKRKTPNKKAKRVGRGGLRGKTSGRGHKGQKARAGHRIRPEFRDQIKKIPKQRGHGQNRSRTVNDGRVKPAVVNLAAIDKSFESGEVVSPQTLFEKKLIRKRGGKLPSVKILGNGELSKKVTFEKVTFSEVVKKQVAK